MKTGLTRTSVVQVNFAFDKQLPDAAALLDRYTTLTGWAEALVAAGAARSTVVQRFHTDARLVRGGVEYLFCRRDVPKRVAALDPDVVHVNGIEFPVAVWTLRRAVGTGAAIVVQSHSDGGAVGRAPLLRASGRLFRGAADAFLVAVEAHAAAWRAAGLIGRRQPVYTVMPASTTFAPVARDAARERTRVVGTPALLWVGRLNANKDPHTVLRAFETVVETCPDASLTMVFGTNELLDDVRARIAANPALGPRVRLVGAVPHGEMAHYFSAADIFVVGSHHEGSGYSLMEAMACGAMPVVTDIPTFRVLTGEGAAGRLWPAGDARACARAIVAAAPHAATEGQRAAVRERFNREFSWAAIGGRARHIYEEVAAGRARAGRP